MYNLLKYTIMIDVRKTLENLHQILPNLSIEDLFRVLDNIVEIPQFNVGQTTTIRRDNSGWRPYDTGTFISYASNGIREAWLLYPACEDRPPWWCPWVHICLRVVLHRFYLYSWLVASFI